MGQVITLLPLLDRTIIVEAEANNFLNAVASTPQALYVRAKQTYDSKMSTWAATQNATKIAQDNLNELRTYFKGWEARINAGDYNDAISFVLKDEGFGDAFYASSRGNKYKKWIGGTQMRQFTNACERLTADNWSYIYNNGILTGEQNYRNCQIDIIKKWLRDLQAKETELNNAYNAAVAAQDTAKRDVDSAKAELDKAIAAEEKASGQRILEKQTDPEYVRLKNEGDMLKLEADAKKAKMRTVLILGLGAFAVVAAVLVLRKK